MVTKPTMDIKTCVSVVCGFVLLNNCLTVVNGKHAGKQRGPAVTIATAHDAAVLESKMDRILQALDDKQAVTDALLEKLQDKERRLDEALQRLDAKEQLLEQRILDTTVAGVTKEGHPVQRPPSTNTKRMANEYNAAFYAQLGNFTIHAAPHETLKFERVLTNVGDGYDLKTGLFTAPIVGVYVFSVTLLSDPGHFNRYQVMKNGVAFTNVLSDAREHMYDTSSQMFVLYLNLGDTVSVTMYDDDGFAHGDNHCAFAGFLQQEDFDAISVVGK